MALGCVSSGNTPEPPALLARSLSDSLWVRRVPFRKCPRAGLPPFWEVLGLDGSAAPNPAFCVSPSFASWRNSLPSLLGPVKGQQELLMWGLLLPRGESSSRMGCWKWGRDTCDRLLPTYCPTPPPPAGAGPAGSAGSPGAGPGFLQHFPGPSPLQLIALPPLLPVLCCFMLCLKNHILHFSRDRKFWTRKKYYLYVSDEVYFSEIHVVRSWAFGGTSPPVGGTGRHGHLHCCFSNLLFSLGSRASVAAWGVRGCCGPSCPATSSGQGAQNPQTKQLSCLDAQTVPGIEAWGSSPGVLGEWHC